MSITVRGDRRLSKMRVTIAFLLTACVGAGAFLGAQSWAAAQDTSSGSPWFAGYVDVTATPAFGFETPATEAGEDVMLSFIVADPTDPCAPSWGAAYSLDAASSELDLDRRIARLLQKGGGIGVSFGGLLNDELATVCTDGARLVEAYGSVVDRYELTTIDLDIESGNLVDREGGERRAAAIAALQERQSAAGRPLAVWLTLPVAPSGLTEDGTTAVAQFLEAGVDVAGVNVMTMDYGSSKDSEDTMAEASIAALKETHRQLGVLYRLADIPLSPGTVWGKLGATPMIGQNDVPAEVFGLDDARALNAFAVEQGIGRMSMWSLNRDTTCGPNYADLRRVSVACSGIDQGDVKFADLLSVGFDGDAMDSSGRQTTAEPTDPEDIVDDPATSPYPIWEEDSAYPSGSKVVWHHNVYESKWWTRGELPDDPVLNTWETPWTLIGPVLKGEKPKDLFTLPFGMFPEWSGPQAYEKGSQVMFEGLPYKARWWTQGDSPEAFGSDPDSSPWVPLTQEEISNAIASPPTVPVETAPTVDEGGSDSVDEASDSADLSTE